MLVSTVSSLQVNSFNEIILLAVERVALVAALPLPPLQPSSAQGDAVHE